MNLFDGLLLYEIVLLVLEVVLFLVLLPLLLYCVMKNREIKTLAPFFCLFLCAQKCSEDWIPACAGMTRISIAMTTFSNSSCLLNGGISTRRAAQWLPGGLNP